MVMGRMSIRQLVYAALFFSRPKRRIKARKCVLADARKALQLSRCHPFFLPAGPAAAHLYTPNGQVWRVEPGKSACGLTKLMDGRSMQCLSASGTAEYLEDVTCSVYKPEMGIFICGCRSPVQVRVYTFVPHQLQCTPVDHTHLSLHLPMEHTVSAAVPLTIRHIDASESLIACAAGHLIYVWDSVTTSLQFFEAFDKPVDSVAVVGDQLVCALAGGTAYGLTAGGALLFARPHVRALRPIREAAPPDLTPCLQPCLVPPLPPPVPAVLLLATQRPKSSSGMVLELWGPHTATRFASIAVPLSDLGITAHDLRPGVVLVASQARQHGIEVQCLAHVFHYKCKEGSGG
eukprot:EG_transcript_18214